VLENLQLIVKWTKFFFCRETVRKEYLLYFSEPINDMPYDGIHTSPHLIYSAEIAANENTWYELVEVAFLGNLYCP
jgi:hypothetical protein